MGGGGGPAAGTLGLWSVPESGVLLVGDQGNQPHHNWPFAPADLYT